MTKIKVYFWLDWISVTVATNYVMCLQYLGYIMGPLCLRITEFSASVFENIFPASVERVLSMEVIECYHTGQRLFTYFKTSFLS